MSHYLERETNKSLMRTTTCLNLQGLLLSEKRHRKLLVHRVPFTQHSRKGKSIETENRLVFAGWGERSITKASQETLWGEKLFFIMVMAKQPNTSIRTHQSLHSRNDSNMHRVGP